MLCCMIEKRRDGVKAAADVPGEQDGYAALHG